MRTHSLPFFVISLISRHSNAFLTAGCRGSSLVTIRMASEEPMEEQIPPPPPPPPPSDESSVENNEPIVVEEDPEVVTLKDEIKRLEDALKAKRLQVAETSDRADEMTKSGYARKVAEMENMRRARNVSTFYLNLGQ